MDSIDTTKGHLYVRMHEAVKALDLWDHYYSQEYYGDVDAHDDRVNDARNAALGELRELVDLFGVALGRNLRIEDLGRL